MRLEAGDFAADPDGAERAFQDVAGDRREIGDRDGGRRIGARNGVRLRLEVQPVLMGRGAHAACSPAMRAAALSVLSISIAIVIAPTPPGTGVMCDATWRADSKCTSPTRR